jgi:hypothetical protein
MLYLPHIGGDMGRLLLVILAVCLGFIFKSDKVEAHMHGASQHVGYECAACCTHQKKQAALSCCAGDSFTSYHGRVTLPKVGRNCSCGVGCCVSADQQAAVAVTFTFSSDPPAGPKLIFAIQAIAFASNDFTVQPGRGPPAPNFIPSFLRHCALLI